MNLFEKNIRKVEPYVPGEQPQRKVIKLNTNENPYPPAPGVQAVLSEMNADDLRLYPDPNCTGLVKELAEAYKVKENQVFVGVGSDDVLAMCFLTFFNSEKPILFPDITYSFYKVWAGLYRIPYECPKLDEDFKLVKEDYYRENGGIIFPNPNAPTSIYEPLSTIEDILQQNQDVIVIVDEAYIDFAGESATQLVDTYNNLVVVQTFSKSRSMAGMRIGYAIANEKLIGYLNAAKHSFNSYTLNRVSLLSGVAAVKDSVYFESRIKDIVETREWVKKELTELGFIYPDSQANFIFATHPKYAAKELFEALKGADIFVRYFNSLRIDNYLRITIGTREEMEKFLEILKDYMK